MNPITRSLAGVALVAGSIVATATVSVPTGAAETAPTFAYSTVRSEAGCYLAKIDLATAAIDDLSGTFEGRACVGDLAVAPDGTPWGIDYLEGAPDGTPIRLVKFSPTTGSIEQIVPVTFNLGGDHQLDDGSLAFIGSTAYIFASTDECTPTGTCLYTVDTATGAATSVGDSGLYYSRMYGLANCGGLVTFAGVVEGDVNFATVNSTTGTATAGPVITYIPAGYDCAGSFGYTLEYSRDDQQVGIYLAPFDRTTGQKTETGVYVDALVRLLALPPAQVPDTTTTTAPSTTTTSSTTVPPRNLSNTIQPRFAG